MAVSENLIGQSIGTPRRKASGHRLLAGLALGLALVLAGCAAPPTGTSDTSADPAPARSEPMATRSAAAPIASPPTTAPAPAPAALPPRSKPAPPMSDPLPAQRVADERPARAAAPKLDRACRTSADCVVKDVGNCCGYYPRCVNVNAAVDPKAVQAQCARSGMASVCGFKPVEGCECVKGECQDKLMMVDAQ